MLDVSHFIETYSGTNMNAIAVAVGSVAFFLLFFIFSNKNVFKVAAFTFMVISLAGTYAWWHESSADNLENLNAALLDYNVKVDNSKEILTADESKFYESDVTQPGDSRIYTLFWKVEKGSITFYNKNVDKYGNVVKVPVALGADGTFKGGN
ncbi:hypothetical protein [Enterococcus sp. AZ180]|uniref:hypothetical protein n=1 Tax=Enterococcus sp. AZ180 TaxID=2774961 RepID=UPI003F255685